LTVYQQVCVLKVTTVGIGTQISLLVLQYTCPRELYSVLNMSTFTSTLVALPQRYEISNLVYGHI